MTGMVEAKGAIKKRKTTINQSMLITSNQSKKFPLPLLTTEE
jgi:hypothetical protein